MKPINRYLTRIYWSDDDDAFIGEIPALPGCMGHGETMAKAAQSLQISFDLWMKMARKHGDPIPEPDMAREEIARFAPVLNLSKLARQAGISKNTLASKLKRGSRFTPQEASSILRAFA